MPISITVPTTAATLFKIYTGIRLINCDFAITTAAADLDCLLQCKANDSCLSVNVRANDQHGGFDCQLNSGVRHSQDCTSVAVEHAWLYEFSP